jgi:lipopolysaccharide/colanic/teichoic acid biosynthesis glycosyltransferase
MLRWWELEPIRLPVGHGEYAEYAVAEALPAVAGARTARFDEVAKRLLDVGLSLALLFALAPIFGLVALAIKLDSPGPVFYRCRRVGKRGREFDMLKFRKMADGAAGLPLTIAGDARFTRAGAFLAATKLDELPQLWNVVRGEMSLVGPRPEDPAIVAMRRDAFAPVLETIPGITGLCQLQFADESSLLDPDDRVGHYLDVLLPQKLDLDRVYAERRTFWYDVSILVWTLAAVALRREVTVDSRSGGIALVVRPAAEPRPVLLELEAASDVAA